MLESKWFYISLIVGVLLWIILIEGISKLVEMFV